MNWRDGASDIEHSDVPKGFDDYELVLGDILRGERATMGKSLLDVQREIKVKASYVAAIEDCDLSAFETPGFIAGYVRSYGRYLGLDPELVYQAFCEQSGFSHVEGLTPTAYATDRKTPRRRARPVTQGGDAVLARNPLHTAPKVNPMSEIRPAAVASLAALLLLLGGLGYGGWSVLQSIQRVTLAPADVPVVAVTVGPDLTADGTPVGPIAGAPRPSADALTQLYRPQVLEAPVLVPRDGPISSVDPDRVGVLAGLPQVQTPPRTLADLALAPHHALEAHLPEIHGPDVPLDLPLGVVAAIPQGEVTVVSPPPPEVVLFARNPVWVRVRASDGTVLLEKILETGERYVLPQTEVPPTLRAGNSGSLFFAVNGETLGPAGPGASVTKNVQLSVAALSDRYAPADLTQDPDLRRLAELVIGPEVAAE